jgi:hypothetical protein
MGSSHSLAGTERAARAGLWDDDDTRAFLAGVAEVAALV